MRPVIDKNKGWTEMGGQFNADIKSVNGLTPIHPDAPGAKRMTYVLRAPMWIPDPDDTTQRILLPECIKEVPYWRAVEMVQEREGMIMTEEQSAPYLEVQRAEASRKESESRALLDAAKQSDPEAGKIDPEIAAMKERMDEQSRKIDQLLAALSAK